MRLKPRHLSLAALAAACLYVAAPALSAEPYLPEAVDFEQAVPALEPVGKAAARVGADHHRGARQHRHGRHLGEGPVSYRSPVISAPERFDLVGIAGELRPLEIRARDEGGAWGEWLETANGDPVYVDGADELQLRARGWRPRGTLHYVNVSGTTSELGGALSDARRAINSAFISASGLFGAEADAAPARPSIVRRSAWGANRRNGGCKPRTRPARGKVKAAAVHHTVTDTYYSRSEAPSIVLGICRYHRNANGWNDIGYNALVDRFGNIYAGRAGGLGRPVVGAHAQGFNAQTTGVAAIGTHTSTPITPATREALISYLAWKLARHRLSAKGRKTLVSAGGPASRYESGRRVRIRQVVGHGSLGRTACPGEALGREVRKLRRQVRKRIAAAGGEQPPPAPPPPTEETGGVPPVAPQGAR